MGSARQTHDLPEGPRLISLPKGDAATDPNHTLLLWGPVEPPNGSPIVGYQVLVVQPDTGMPALPKISLDVMMPPTATSLEVPAGYLQGDTAYAWEVPAVEVGGNQTLSSSFFRTTP